MKLRTIPQALALALLCMLASFTLDVPAASAQQISIVVAKTLGAGADGEPADPGAVFVARQLVGFPATGADNLADAVREHPELLSDAPGYPFGEPATATADDAGIVRFYDLPEGVYQLTEKPRRTTNVHEDIATPVLVSVEEPGPAYVRAKNQPVVVDKHAKPDSVEIGEAVTYSIVASIPHPDANGEVHQYVLTDPLDPRLNFRFARLRVTNLTGDKNLSEPADYAVEVAGNVVTVTLSNSGRAALADAALGHPEARVHLDLEAVVNKTARPGDRIPNTAQLSPDGYCLKAAADCRAAEESPTAYIAVPAEDADVNWNNGSGSGRHDNKPGPGHAPAPDPSGKQHAAPGGSPLASTGASVIGIVILAAVLIALGWWLSRRREDEQ